MLDRQPPTSVFCLMRLLSIDIRNFRVIKQASIAFPDNVVGIIGPNGAGKSSIVEAVAWALYGNPACRSGKDEIRAIFADQADTCHVDLSFEVNGEVYRVVRRLVGRTARAEVELFRSGKPESVGSTETQRHIAGILGLDWRGFLTSFLARQQELNALSDLQPARRREHLAGMLGIERLDKALQRVKEDTRLSEEKAAFVSSQLAQKEQVAERVSQLQAEIAGVKSRLDDQSGAYELTTASLSQLAERYAAEQERRDACSRIMAQIDSESRTAEMLTAQLDAFRREHETLLGFRRELGGLEKDLADFDTVKAEVETGREARSRVEYAQQLGRQRDGLQAESNRVSEKADEIENNFSDINRQLADLPADIEKLAEQSQVELEKARDQFSQTRAGGEMLAKEIARVKKQITDIHQIGPETVCDRCHRPYGSDLPEIRKHLEKELLTLSDEESRLADQLSAVRKRGEELKQQHTDLTRKVARRYQLAVRREALDKERQELTRRRNSLREQLQEVAAKLDEVGRVTFDAERHRRAAGRLAELEQKRSRFSQLSGGLSRMPEVEKGLAVTNDKVAAANAEVIRLRSELKNADFDQQRFERTAAEYTKVQQKAETEKTSLLELSKELEVLQKELAVKQEQMEGYDKAEKALERHRSDQYYGEKLGGLFKDFRKHVIARIRPRLSELSSSLFAEMTGDRFNWVELDEDYNLQIRDYGQLFGIERFSGGEKDLANLCLRLAISLALTESAGLDRSFVILDEVFGSQDDDRRSLIFSGLASLKSRFPQILLITHIEEIKHRVETLIEVEPVSGGWSEVKINDQVAG